MNQIDYNKLVYLKQELEEIYIYFEEQHNNLLNMIENSECLDDEKYDIYHSNTKEYEALISLLKSNFMQLESKNKNIESCFSQTKLLKKKRLTKLDSKMNISLSQYNNDVNDIPF